MKDKRSFKNLYICIPHKSKAFITVSNNKPNKENYDRYIKGDHDYKNIIKIKSIKQLKDIKNNYKDHQYIKVSSLAEHILKDKKYYYQEINTY